MCCRKYVTCSNRVGQLVCGVGYVAMERGKDEGLKGRKAEKRGEQRVCGPGVDVC